MQMKFKYSSGKLLQQQRSYKTTVEYGGEESRL